MRTCELTEPFFCDMPVMSSTDTSLPSKCAAMPSNAPKVITPVPPMPLINMLCGLSQGAVGGEASSGHSLSSRAVAPADLDAPPVTETKLGQKPLTQE